jgi:dCTP diphosphatase
VVLDEHLDRDWAQFHDPKSLILALVGEVGELAGAEPLLTRADEEMADVLLYLVRLADVLGLDLAVTARAKLARAGERFPVDDVRGEAPSKG